MVEEKRFTHCNFLFWGTCPYYLCQDEPSSSCLRSSLPSMNTPNCYLYVEVELMLSEYRR